MSIEQAILETVRMLPADKQQEILNHAARLRDEASRNIPFKSVRGLWKDLGVSLSSEEIEENQRDLWQNFAEDIPMSVVVDTHTVVWYLSADDRLSRMQLTPSTLRPPLGTEFTYHRFVSWTN